MVQVHKIQTPDHVDDQRFEPWRQSIVSKIKSQQQNDYSETCWRNAIDLLRPLNINDNPVSFAYRKGFDMANTLSLLGVGNSTLLAAMLAPFVESSLVSIDLIEQNCASDIGKQLRGIASMDAIRGLQSGYNAADDSEQLDNLRKMLLVMVDDVRVVLLKLAERLSVLRQVIVENSAQKDLVAAEISDVYAPLANRLGVGQIKWEMEDLAFRVIEPEEYTKIAKSLAEKRVDREVYVTDVLAQLNQAIKALQVEAQLEGRAKHIYSIWKKMQRKQVGFAEIYDIRAVRVLVPEIRDCYSVLGAVHGLWKHIPKEFDDYIATPKENGYRSLHTAVIGPRGKTLEIQIRTHQMHKESELGVAAHWKYKEGKKAPDDNYINKIAWLRQLLEWQDEVTASADMLEEFRNQVLEERIYVFTPKGKLIDLPKGSTALDFAYRVHSEIGHRCRGAKANGRIITLTQALQTGQKIEILTAKNGGPSRDWLNEHQGYIRSSRTRAKVTQWFKQQDKQKNAQAGKNMLEKEIQKNKLKSVEFSKVAKHFNYNSNDELFAGIGAGDKGLHQVINYIRANQQKEESVTRNTVIKKPPQIAKRSASSDILVEGVGNLLTRIAACCKPVPGDSIAGYVTQSRGIMIHRNDCHYLLNSQSKYPEKILHVSWGGVLNKSYLIDLLIKAYDRKGLLSDLTSLMAEEKISVTALNTHVNKKRLMFSINMQIEVSSLDMVARIISKIEQLNTIVSVQRK